MDNICKIITVGLNLAIDRVIEVKSLQVGSHQEGKELSRTPGGKAFNISRVCAALKTHSIATGFLAADTRALYDQALAGGFIEDQFVEVPGLTRENITLLDRLSGSDTHIRDQGQPVTSEQIKALSNTLASLACPESIIIFSGSLPSGFTPAEHSNLVRSCVEAGARVAVDTSGPALADLAAERFWLAKPNLAELAQLTGKTFSKLDDQLSAARTLTKRISNILLSAGGEGAYLFTPDRAYHASVKVSAEKVLNTVGCGDALLGAFISAITLGQPKEQALISAVATASACAISPASAQFNQATREDMISRVELTQL